MPTMPRRFVNYILDLMFPCDHRQESWPQTRDGRTYKTCLHCGHETEYSMEDMCDITPAYLRFKRRMAKQAARERLKRRQLARTTALEA
jgi:adenine-specific DNA methylase